MAYARVIIGGFIFMIGILTLVRTIFENMPTPNNPLPQVLDFSKTPDIMIVVIVETVIIAVGIVILASSKRSSQSSNH